MANELEDRLQALETELKQAQAANTTAAKTKRRRRWFWIVLPLVVLLVGGGAAAFYLTHRDSQPIPASVRKTVSFPLYFPSRSDTGYAYVAGSAKKQSDILFFSIRNGKSVVSMTQQAIPVNPPNLDYYQDFKKLDVPAGDAIIGTANGLPTVIISTNTTLVIMTGAANLPTDVLAQLAKAMGSLPS